MWTRAFPLGQSARRVRCSRYSRRSKCRSKRRSAIERGWPPTDHARQTHLERVLVLQVASEAFTRDELAEAFAKFEQTVDQAAQTRNGDPWVEQYSPDIVYVEHAAGTMRGREEVRSWIWKTMETFPGSYMTAFPSLWSVIDEPTGRIICELDNPMRDPGDGTIISATNISIITYAGDGQWCRQEDIYNPLRFLQAGIKWCKNAEELDTLDDDAARWMRQYGAQQGAAPAPIYKAVMGWLNPPSP